MGFTPQQLALPDLENHPARRIPVPGERHGVQIAAARIDSDMTSLELLKAAEDVAELGGTLELQRTRRLGHPLGQLLGQPAGVTLKDEQHFIDHFPVLRLALVAHARRLAATDVVVEAGTRRRLLWEVVMTGANRVKLLDGP